MTVLRWKERPGTEYSDDKDGVREYRRVFLLETDGRDTADSVREFEIIPKRYEQHPNDPLARCVSRRVSHYGKGSKFFLVEPFYTTDIFSEIENPLERPPEIEWSTVEYAEARLVDLDGRPLVNTVGEPLEGIQIESPGLVANVKIYLADKPTWFRSMINSVNEGTFAFDGEGFDSGELRVKSLSCSRRMNEQQIWFREVQIELQSREGGWQRRVLNRGYYELAERTVVSETGESDENAKKEKYPRQIMIDGTPCVEPQLLTVDGKHLQLVDKDGVLLEDKMSEVVLIDFKVRHERDFSVLPVR